MNDYTIEKIDECNDILNEHYGIYLYDWHRVLEQKWKRNAMYTSQFFLG